MMGRPAIIAKAEVLMNAAALSVLYSQAFITAQDPDRYVKEHRLHLEFLARHL